MGVSLGLQLSKEQRLFIDEALKGKNILLTDDVLTTGATADAICKKLLSAGAANVYLATVASVQYKPEKG